MVKQITILQVLPKLDTGGAERVAIEIADGLSKAGHRALIACEGGVLSQAAQRAGAELIKLPLDTKSPFAMRRNAGRLARLIKAQKIDIIHAHSRAPAWSAHWASQRTGIKSVTTYHGAYKENVPFKRRYNAVMASGDRVVAVSAFIADLVRARHPQASEKLRVVPGGVDPQKFDPAAVLGDRAGRLATLWRVPPGAPTIMLPGRLTSLKGQEVLLNAMAALRHKDAVAVLVGSDQGRERYAKGLIEHATRLGIADRLRLVGHVEDMPAAMMLADIVVNASTQPEAFGRTIVEAQAMARLVIAADHGGARETIIDGETGFLFTPGDAAALAASIDRVLDLSADDRINWGQYARAMVSRHFSIAAMQDAMLDVYGELLPAIP